MSGVIVRPQDESPLKISCQTDILPLLTVIEKLDTGEVEVCIHRPAASMSCAEQVGVLREAIRKLQLHHISRAPQTVEVDFTKLLWDEGVRETPHHRIRPTMPVKPRRL